MLLLINPFVSPAKFETGETLKPNRNHFKNNTMKDEVTKVLIKRLQETLKHADEETGDKSSNTSINLCSLIFALQDTEESESSGAINYRLKTY